MAKSVEGVCGSRTLTVKNAVNINRGKKSRSEWGSKPVLGGRGT